MKKPKPISPAQLVHPKAEQKSSWNGDTIRPKESQGFMARRESAGLGIAYSPEHKSSDPRSKRTREVLTARPLKPLPSAKFPVASRRSD